MATVNAWQKITRVLPGQPFGDGADGALSSATIPTPTNKSCSGTTASTTLTIASSGFSNGEIILIHQTRGTGAGQYEINRILSGGGTTTLTLAKPLQYTYTDSGASQAQCIKIPRYSSVTVQSGTWTLPSWNGDTGGIFVMACKGVTTVTGTIDGFNKGFYSAGLNYSGESPLGPGVLNDRNPNGPGGGGENVGAPSVGAGASYDGTGGTGGVNDASTDATNPTVGTFDVSKAFLGSAGGSGAQSSGGTGGCFVYLITRSLSIAGAINVSGGGAAGPVDRPGGGGAGGYLLIACNSATLGTTLASSTGGAAGTRANGWNGHPTNGTDGRIHIDHSGVVTGTTYPTYDDGVDPSLVETSAAFGLFV